MKMTASEAAEILRGHNAWRRDSDDEPHVQTNPRRLGVAIDIAVAALERDAKRDRAVATEAAGMKIEGTVVEMGNLEGMTTPGIRIESGNQFIAISGLTREQITALPPVLFRTVTIEVELAP